MLKYKNKIIAAVIILAVLVFAFWWGGNSQSLHGFNIGKPEETGILTIPETSVLPVLTAETLFTDEPVLPETTETAGPVMSDIPYDTGFAVSSLPEETKEQPEDALPASPPENTVNEIPDYSGAEIINKNIPEITEKKNSHEDENKEMHCTLAVSCTEIIENTVIPPEKKSVIPENGIIYAPKSVVFYDGETVFDVLRREMQNNRIHLEFSKTPLYDSYYIEGINNIYEFDFGELSGWLYSVNGVFPQYSSSQYTLKNGDNISWIYTCNKTIK